MAPPRAPRRARVGKSAAHEQTTALEIVDGKIVAVHVVRNPDKLAGAAGYVAAPAPLP
ncbi:MAG TPA: hypothetical protein VEY30_07055 [Myxococcaceae bacterium]|nr:hypothetical protein [Myxococcaceae bacterium]